MLTHLQFVDRLTVVFNLVDDLLKALPRSPIALPSGRRNAGRPSSLSTAEVLTLALFRFWTNQPNWKTFWQVVNRGFRAEFPRLPSYEAMLRQINAHAPLALLLLVALLGKREAVGVYRLDATALELWKQETVGFALGMRMNGVMGEVVLGKSGVS